MAGVGTVRVSGEFPKGPVEYSRSFSDYISDDRSSITLFRDICWESVSWVFSPVHCGKLVWVITLAGQSAVWDS